MEARSAGHSAVPNGPESATDIHSIRLRGPWTWRPVGLALDALRESLESPSLDLGDGPGFSPTAKAREGNDGVRFQAPHGLQHVALPLGVEWILLERTFHRPTGLTDADQLHLRFCLPQATQAWLNHAAQQIQAADARWNVTHLLTAHNRLTLLWPVAAIGTTHAWDVALEIETARID